MKSEEIAYDQFLTMSINEIKEIADKFVVKGNIIFIDTRLKDGIGKITISPPEFGKLPKDKVSRYQMIKKLQSMDLTQSEIARVTGKTQSLISKIIKQSELEVEDDEE